MQFEIIILRVIRIKSTQNSEYFVCINLHFCSFDQELHVNGEDV